MRSYLLVAFVAAGACGASIREGNEMNAWAFGIIMFLSWLLAIIDVRWKNG